tara:strand:+ start:551 stop:1714 length:1164 start_codon:yes stop_codon:yes gene_type:complete
LDKKLKILRLIPTLNPIAGGPTEALIKITPFLNKLDVETSVITFDSPADDFIKNHPFKVIPLGPVNTIYGYKRNIPNLIKEVAKDKNFVIVHGIWQYHSFATWRALRNTNIPYFVFTHGMLDPLFKKYFPLKHLKKWLYWPWAEFRVLRDAQGVLFTTNEEKILARKSFWLYKVNEIVTGYGTAPPPSNKEIKSDLFFEKYQNLKSKNIILFMGRIHKKKGIDILLKSFSDTLKNNKKYVLVIAGPDSYGLKTELVNLAKDLKINDQIYWTGMLKGELKWSAFRASELFCLPSYGENFGIVVAEALGCGLPVAISNKVNIYKKIESGKSGIIFNNNPKGLNEALKLWLSLSPDKKLEMSQNAINTFNNEFNLENISKNFLKIIMKNL